MISVNQLNLQYGKKYIFKDISARINNHDRIGLVGVNGTGKSTLLKMIVGQIETDSGVIIRSKMATIGYLPQEVTAIPPGRTVYQEAEAAFAETLKYKERMDELNHELAASDPSSPHIAALLEEQGELQILLDQADIFSMQSRIEKILHGLGFSDEDMQRECKSFSGGWIMRLMLAKQLLASPTFMLLDEPTNHLDIESLTWLEDFLKNYTGALVIISHDRTFLDTITTSTWELSLGQLTIYKGNYSKYVAEKDIRMEVQRAAYENQQAQIQQTKRFIERFRAKSTKASQVQSRVKQLAKMEIIELDDTDQQVSFRFPPAAPSGRLSIATENLAKSFGSKDVFTDLTFELQRGEKMGIVGVNGAGKSTLVKLLAGLTKPDSGRIRSGHNVIISYFGQHQAQELPGDYTVMEVMMSVDNNLTVTQIRSLLGTFLFRGDEVDKKVMVLSGGEKSRLALARMISSPANLLIMDEPTNHLDMQSQEILQEAMAQYDGSIIVVSHNRYFADSFINKVLEIKNGAGTVYDGNIAYYLEKTRATLDSAANIRQSEAPSAVEDDSGKKVYGKEARQALAKARAEKSKVLGPLKKEAAGIEKKVAELEEQKAKLEEILADPELYQNQEAFSEKSREYTTVDRQLKRAYDSWEEISARIEKTEAELGEELP
ncbi:MAG: ABC-F family ATP-binding cassette domain-containing protein [Proteobacteria bacterium]|nr:ABC-F family ATP-binding cassette domain-containing protein [Pseudomonadota bacterium]MBU1739250.1 ABC-F family ATP-binding cassette domain-containing protein [Pseudomonadota bacterium]